MARRKKKGRRSLTAAWSPSVRLRGTLWMVDCGFVFGRDKRLRKFFTEEIEARKWAAAKADERRTLVTAAAAEDKAKADVRIVTLPDAERGALLAAWHKIKTAGGKPRDLVTAAERYVATVLKVRQSMTLAAAIDAYVESRPTRRPATVADIRYKLDRFAAHFGKETNLADIEADAVQDWLRESIGATGRTFNAYRGHVRALFRFAVRKGWLSVSPAAEIEHDAEEHGTPATLSPKEVEKLLATTAAKYPELMPYIALGVFAGLRPERELGKLSWSSVDLDNARLTVTAENAKRRRARNVPLSENAVAWLRRYAPPHPAATVFYSRGKLRGLRKAAAVPWSKDIMRHTYASYLLAQCEDEALVAARMGNSVAMVRDHYNGARNATEAAAFWKITPPKKGIIQFPKAEVA